MYVLLALCATLLTSLLPIFNKHILRDARPALVAWAINAASLPILALGTLLVTECTTRPHAGFPLSCSMQVPRIDIIFLVALFSSAILNWVATLLSTSALARGDASLVSPLFTFNPAFTLLVAWGVLGEVPGLRQSLGVAAILLGVYIMEVKEARTGLLAPLLSLVQQKGALAAIAASGLWGITTVVEKVAIEHVMPQNGPLVALGGTIVMVVLLTPGALLSPGRSGRRDAEGQTSRGTLYGLNKHLTPFIGAALIAGVAPIFGFTAIALGPVGYVTALFKLSTVLTILWAYLFLHEGNLRPRLLGTVFMIVGSILIAA